MRRILQRPELKVNEMQRRLSEIYRWCREHKKPCRIIILKPRQKGASTFSIWLLYWHLRNFVAKGCIIGDEFEKSVKNLVAMFDFYADRDAFPWGTSYAPASGVFSHGSELITETANDPRAGASGTMQAVVETEVAHWPLGGVCDAAGVLLALEQCVPDAPDTMIVCESTPNGAQGAFYDRWQGAAEWEEFQEGSERNGFVRVFFAWFDFDDSRIKLSAAAAREIIGNLDAEERELVTKYGLDAEQLAWRRQTIARKCGGDLDKFKQEYPSDAVSCFLSSGRPRFQLDKIAALRQAAELSRPLRGVLTCASEPGSPVGWLDDPSAGWVRMWERPAPGNRYLVSVDVMTGKEQTVAAKKEPDNHAVFVLRAAGRDQLGKWRREAVVARIVPPCRVEHDVLAQRIELLSRFYGGCLIVPEVDGPGLALLQHLKKLALPIYRRKVWDEKTSETLEVIGWKTTSATRPMIVDALAQAIRDAESAEDGLSIPCTHALDECAAFIVTESGRAEARVGAHDDDVLALAIGHYAIDGATVYQERKAERPMDPAVRAMWEQLRAQEASGGQYSA